MQQNKNIYCAILAGGSGTRMNSPVPKQFHMLGEKPIFIYGVETLLRDSRVKELWIGANGDWLTLAREQLEEYCSDRDRVRLCEGGADREGTLLNILNGIRSNNELTDNDIVLIHDAVRPFVTPRIIDDVINELDCCDACNTVIELNDTIVRSADGNIVSDMPARNELFAGQSPQGFKLKKLFEAFESLDENTRKLMTETTKACFACGIPIHLVRGEYFNFKITTPYDMQVANTVLNTIYKDIICPDKE